MKGSPSLGGITDFGECLSWAVGLRKQKLRDVGEVTYGLGLWYSGVQPLNTEHRTGSAKGRSSALLDRAGLVQRAMIPAASWGP